MYKLAITIGDINGIGPEIIVKALAFHDYPEGIEFIIIGNKTVIDNILIQQKLQFSDKITFLDPETSIDSCIIEYGKPTITSGEIAYRSLECAINLSKSKKVHAIVTAPISKKALQLAGYNFSGHTEVLQAMNPGYNAQMLFASNTIKLLLLTRHVSLKELPKLITRELIVDNVKLLVKNIERDFSLHGIKIAICALNPHAGEEGTIGTEEQNIIIPAVDLLRSQNIDISGPYPADSFWKTAYNFDVVVALYHDQGLIPLKALSGDDLVNITIGLPVVRTSPCHGTAYDIAGRYIASELSMVSAIKQAIKIVTSRKNGFNA